LECEKGSFFLTLAFLASIILKWMLWLLSSKVSHISQFSFENQWPSGRELSFVLT